MTLEYIEISEDMEKKKAAVVKEPMTASQMLDELDVRTLPDGKHRIFSMKFVTNEGKLHYFPQVFITGVRGQDMKRMRYRGVQPCDCKGNPELHIYPVKITNILELDGHAVDWSNGYVTSDK